jgi:hypothetical protein
MASPSLVNSWEQPTITPLPEPRRSPRLSNPKSAAAATPASDNKENAARQRKSATPVGLCQLAVVTIHIFEEQILLLLASHSTSLLIYRVTRRLV